MKRVVFYKVSQMDPDTSVETLVARFVHEKSALIYARAFVPNFIIEEEVFEAFKDSDEAQTALAPVKTERGWYRGFHEGGGFIRGVDVTLEHL